MEIKGKGGNCGIALLIHDKQKMRAKQKGNNQNRTNERGEGVSVGGGPSNLLISRDCRDKRLPAHAYMDRKRHNSGGYGQI